MSFNVLWSGAPTMQANVDASDFWLPIVVVFGGNFLFFFFCQWKKDNSYIDALWGLTFWFPILALILKRYVSDTSQDPDARCWIVATLVGIWGIRLCQHILKRHRAEDFRYVKMRTDWTAAGGHTGYLWRAFIYVFMLQALFSVICNAAALYVIIYSKSSYLIWLDFVGIALWIFGFVFEIVGDMQLASHIADKTPGKKKFINMGLWRFTRHPNYFGEACLWWGIYLIACSVEWGWITIFAPAFITFLVRFLSGVPLLEQKYKGNPEWEAYCDQVNVFFPWIPSKPAKNPDVLIPAETQESVLNNQNV